MMTKEEALEKHARVLRLLKLAAQSREFTQEELLNMADLLTGYCTRGEKWDVQAGVMKYFQAAEANGN